MSDSTTAGPVCRCHESTTAGYPPWCPIHGRNSEPGTWPASPSPATPRPASPTPTEKPKEASLADRCELWLHAHESDFGGFLTVGSMWEIVRALRGGAPNVDVEGLTLDVSGGFNAGVVDAWAMLFSDDNEFAGIKTRTGKVDHEPRWDFSRPMTAQEVLNLILRAARSGKGGG